MRLIDADALRDRMYHDAFETDTDMQKWDSGCWIRYKLFENAIDEQPTIEPKQGEWIEEMYNATAQIWKCSECAEQIWQPPSTEYPTYNFCPNCGARMKGTDNE